MHNLKLDFKNLFSIASPRRTQNNDINILLLLEISAMFTFSKSSLITINIIGLTKRHHSSDSFFFIDNIFVQFAGQLYQQRSAFQQVQIVLE